MRSTAENTQKFAEPIKRLACIGAIFGVLIGADLLRNIRHKQTVPRRDWTSALSRFTIQFKDRMDNFDSNTVDTAFRIDAV